VPDTDDLDTLAHAAASCRGCRLQERATQVVFGHGPPGAPVVLVGEQPGDVEDREGRPFVGPAGRLLRSALERAGGDASQVFLTNAVKHFSFTERGKRRIHATPKRGEVVACHPWLEAELRAVRPRAVGCLGATAAQAIFGPKATVSALRNTELVVPGTEVAAVVTVHPSAILRARSPERDELTEQLTTDLRRLLALGGAEGG
jgi:uracil-DNA glycosylase family protein